MIEGNVRVQHSNQGNYTVIRIINKALPGLLGVPSGAKVKNGYSVPEWIFSSLDFVKPFLRGLIETDGGIYIIHRGAATGWHIHFTAYYEPIMQAFLRGAQMLGYKFRRKGTKLLSALSKKQNLL